MDTGTEIHTVLALGIAEVVAEGDTGMATDMADRTSFTITRILIIRLESTETESMLSWNSCREMLAWKSLMRELEIFLCMNTSLCEVCNEYYIFKYLGHERAFQ